MKKKIQRYLMIGAGLVVCWWGCFGAPNEGQAEERMGDFSVEAVLPDNQLTPDIDYFHLLVKPSETQELAIRLTNHKKKKQTYTLAVNTATTNRNGHLSYLEPNKVLDKSLAHPMSEVVGFKTKKVRVDGGKTRIIRLTVTAPQKPFKGILLGGLTISEQSNEQTQNEQGISVKNALTYTIGIVLTEEKDTPIYGETALILDSVKLKKRNDQVIAEANIQNPKPEIVKSVEVSGRLKKEGQTLTKKTKKKVKFAPNSTFSFELPLNSEGMTEAGTYWFEGEAKTDTRTWKFSKKCVLSEEEAKKLSRTQANGRSRKWLIGLLLVGGLGGSIYLFCFQTEKVFKKGASK